MSTSPQVGEQIDALLASNDDKDTEDEEREEDLDIEEYEEDGEDDDLDKETVEVLLVRTLPLVYSTAYTSTYHAFLRFLF